MEQKFYICERCGNIIAKVKDSGVPVMCCGQAMKEIVPGTSDASLQTKNGNQRKTLSPEDKPEASFAIIEGDEVESVFAYCNLHSLWKA